MTDRTERGIGDLSVAIKSTRVGRSKDMNIGSFKTFFNVYILLEVQQE